MTGREQAFANGVELWRLLGYVTPRWRVLFAAVGLMLGESAIALLNPWIAMQLTSLVTQAEGLTGAAAGRLGLSGLIALWALLLAVQAGLSFGNRFLLASTGAAMLAALRSRLYDHLQSLPLGYFHTRRRGEVLALLANDAAQINHFVTATLVSLLPLLATFVGAAYLLARISPAIAGVAVMLVPLFFVAMKLIGRRLRPLASETVRRNAEMFSALEENIGMLPSIKAFTREGLESARFQQRNEAVLRVSNRRFVIESVLSPAVRLLAGLGLLLLVYAGALSMRSGALSPADVVGVLLYGMLMTRPVGGLADVYGSVQTARGSALRLLEAFAEQPEPDDAGAPALPSVEGRIVLDAVEFGYPGRPTVLRGASLAIEAGETVAITGPNGSGKSTIVHLLMRFADPAAGRILVDGVDIRTVSIGSLRRQIGLVPQQVLLLNGTVRENITYGFPQASPEEVGAAAELAQADDFIQQLPAGYDTLIGDQGIRLSGGQRQRLALARALLKAPPVLILDEATAMFDPDGEQSLIESCGPILRCRTVILITHRPASLALASRVFAMNNGRLEDLSCR